MALKPCKECGKEVSEKADKCPNCGVADPTGANAKALQIGALGCLGLFAVFFVFISLAGGGGGSDRTPDPAPTLSATVRMSGMQLHVTNDDVFTWTDCVIDINGGIRSGFTQRIARIAAGETVSGGLMAFTRSGGERFNPITHAVESVSVRCGTPQGRGYWGGRF